MITLDEVEDAIRELEDAPHNFQTCQKLATFYLLRDYLAGGGDGAINEVRRIEAREDSEFMRVVSGCDSAEVLAVLDELMDTLAIVNPRLYDGVMRRLDELA